MESKTIVYTEHPTVKFNTHLTNTEDEALHSHHFVEIFYIVSGNIKHVIEGKTQDLTVGDLFLIRPNVQHRFIRDNENCTHRDFVINVSLARQAFDFIDYDFYDQLEEKKYMICKISIDDIIFIENNIKNYFKMLEVEKRRKFEKVIVGNLLGLVYLYTNHDDNIDNFRSQCEEAVSNAYIMKNAVEIVRNELGYSKNYLCKKFKSTFGETLLNYINKYKFNYAAYLLKTTNYKLPEICDQIGIESLPYFINVFTKKYGITPSKYRKLK